MRGQHERDRLALPCPGISQELAGRQTMIKVQLLGSACLRSGDTVLGGPPAQRHRIALLALIVDAWPQPLSRDRALALLWPERDDAGGRPLLNLAIHVLRSALGDEGIVSRGDARNRPGTYARW